MTVTQIALGLWPIAGITTVGVSQDDADQTIIAAIESGITTFDTAFSYGYEGESDRILGKHLRGRRERFTVIGKVGQRWTSGRERIIDGSRKALISDAEQSLRRIGVDEFDLLMLHCPDPNVPLQDSCMNCNNVDSVNAWESATSIFSNCVCSRKSSTVMQFNAHSIFCNVNHFLN